MAKIEPIGNPNNLNSWGAIIEYKDIAKVNQRGHTDLYEHKRGIIDDLGANKYDKLVKARYDWLFDDLQRFTSIKPESIETKDDLKMFVEATVGESKGFVSMREKAPRRYQSSVNRMVEGLWRKGSVDKVAKTNVVEDITPQKVSKVKERLKSEKTKRKVEFDARSGHLWLVRREKPVAKRIDKLGRVYYINLLTGRRERDPIQVLKELGFRV